MSDHLHATHTVVTEGQAFGRRHPDLPEAAQVAGMLAWGLLRAVAECPDCPGVFRLPSDADWTHLDCPQCRGRWTYQQPVEAVVKPARKRRAKTP